MDRKPIKTLMDKIDKRTATCAVIGLGYVGLPLAVEFGKAGFNVVGIDLDKKKIAAIKSGVSYIPDVPSEDITALVEANTFEATDDYDLLREVDTISICVPTPLRKSREPDISFIIKASDHIQKHLRPGQLIVLESTTYPGTTDETILPMLEETGLRVGKDFCLAFSPERVDPGNVNFQTQNIPKVVGGITPVCTEAVKALYGSTVTTVVGVSSPRVAEMVKLLENTFRSVNIALVNELALMCDSMKVDVWEVIDAAATKPFGFMPFYPGPGLGGHCIPVDPLYLTWKARLHGFEPKFIELATEVNRAMPKWVVSKIQDSLNEKAKSLRGAKVLILGVAYKRDVSDVRESPALEIIELLIEKGAQVIYNDPYVPTVSIAGKQLTSAPLTDELFTEIDTVAIITDHTSYDYGWINNKITGIVDTRNAIRKNEK